MHGREDEQLDTWGLLAGIGAQGLTAYFAFIGAGGDPGAAALFGAGIAGFVTVQEAIEGYRRARDRADHAAGQDALAGLTSALETIIQDGLARAERDARLLSRLQEMEQARQLETGTLASLGLSVLGAVRSGFEAQQSINQQEHATINGALEVLGRETEALGHAVASVAQRLAARERMEADVYALRANGDITITSLRAGARRDFGPQWSLLTGLSLHLCDINAYARIRQSQGIGNDPKTLFERRSDDGRLWLLGATVGASYQSAGWRVLCTYTAGYATVSSNLSRLDESEPGMGTGTPGTAGDLRAEGFWTLQISHDL